MGDFIYRQRFERQGGEEAGAFPFLQQFPGVVVFNGRAAVGQEQALLAQGGNQRVKGGSQVGVGPMQVVENE